MFVAGSEVPQLARGSLTHAAPSLQGGSSRLRRSGGVTKLSSAFENSSESLCYDITVVVLDDGCEVGGSRTPPWTGSWSTPQRTPLTHTLAGAGGGVKSLV